MAFDGRTLCRAILRRSGGAGCGWWSFDDPVDCLTAWDLDEVVGVVAAAERAAATGQWVVGMLSYDAGPAFDRAVVARRDPAVPLAAFAVFDTAVDAGPQQRSSWSSGPWVSSIGLDRYRTDIDRIQDLIVAGDTYQVNHTFRMEGAFEGDAESFFVALHRAQNADYSAFLDLGDASVCSASPELLVRRVGTRVEARPMKGTRPRHRDPREDASLAHQLRHSAKELAENTMIVDMVRNDLGRVARVGTLAVPVLHHIETYPTVHQMTSTVTAETDASLLDLLAAVFPGASITGAPKYRTSRIIADVEHTPRGLYTGAIGLLRPGGDLEFSIAIRTAWIDRTTGRAHFGVGGGIVADGTVVEEWAEAHQKARVLRRAAAPFELLETMRWEPGRGVALEARHLDRMERSARYFGFRFDRSAARAALEGEWGDTPARLRLLSDSAGAVRVDASPAPALGDDEQTPVWQVPLAPEAVDSTDEFLWHKTTRRDVYDQARQAFPDAPDVVLWNERDELTESTIANVVLEIGDRLVTPALGSGLLAGTMRAELLDDGVIEERVVPVSDLGRASRTWLVNSVRGWVPCEISRRPPGWRSTPSSP